MQFVCGGVVVGKCEDATALTYDCSTLVKLFLSCRSHTCLCR